MTHDRLSLTKDDILTQGKETNSSWSNLQESAYSFMKEHKTEIAVGAAALLTGAAALKFATRATAGATESATANLASKEVSPAASAITRGEAAFPKTNLEWVGKSESFNIPDSSHPDILPSSLFHNAIVGRAPRSGEALANTFMGDGTQRGQHFADAMKSMAGIEIPRFAEAYAEKVTTGVARHNIGFILDRSAMPEGSERIWSGVLSNLSAPGEFRTGQQLVRDFLGHAPGSPSSAYADVLAKMKPTEIPRLTRELDSMVSTATENLEFYLSHAKLSAETKPVWEAALARLLK